MAKNNRKYLEALLLSMLVFGVASSDAFAQQKDAGVTDLVPEDVKELIFENMMDSNLPMSPAQIKDLKKRLDDTQKAAQTPINGKYPKAEVKVQAVSLEPGVEPSEIKVSVGYVTTVGFLDATGQPWPILDYGVGGNFDIPTPEDGSHILRITPLTRHGVGNLSVRLVGLTTPISFKLAAGNDVVHYRFDARVAEYGPNAKAPLINQTLVAGDKFLMSLLDGDAPKEFERMNVFGVDSRTAVWKNGDVMYVRTPLTLLSPGWDASVASSDGTTVYQMMTTPVLLLSDNGMMIRVSVGQREVKDE